MIQQKPKFQIISDDSMSSAQFSLKSENLAHIFDVLRTKIYSDKILAVIREYSTNAYDANIENNKKHTPINVTLPTVVEPIFQVRDFGLGLSEEDIFEVYSSYGASTKRNTNELVGALGFGSKAGFAYADSFTVTSWHGGKKKVYEAFIDETKIGTIAKVHEENSNEPTGIAVTVSVNKEDIYSFVDKATQFYRWFNPMPVFFGHDLSNRFDSLSNNINIVHQSKAGFLYYDKGSYSSTLSVRMGNICYPVDRTKLQNVNVFDKWSYHTILDVNIGDVSFTTSRESLEMTPSTVVLIEQKLKQMQDEIIKNYQDDINKAETPWDALIAFDKLPHFPRDFVFQNIEWNGKKLNPHILNTVEWSTYNRSQGMWQKSSVMRSPKMVLVFNDGGFPSSHQRTRLMDVYERERLNDAEVKVYFCRANVTETKEFLDNLELEGAKIVKLSEVNATPKRGKRNSQHTKNQNIFKWNGNVTYPYSTCWNSVADNEISNKKRKIYVRISSYKPNDMDIRRLRDVKQTFNALGWGDIEIFGVKDSVKLNNTWVELRDYFDEKADLIMLDKDFREAYVNSCLLSELKANDFTKIIVGQNHYLKYVEQIECPKVKKLVQINITCDYKLFHEKLSFVRYTQRTSSNSKLMAKRQTIFDNMDIQVKTKAKAILDEANSVLEKYPLLKKNQSYYSWSITAGETQNYIDYINSMYHYR